MGEEVFALVCADIRIENTPDKVLFKIIRLGVLSSGEREQWTLISPTIFGVSKSCNEDDGENKKSFLFGCSSAAATHVK